MGQKQEYPDLPTTIKPQITNESGRLPIKKTTVTTTYSRIHCICGLLLVALLFWFVNPAVLRLKNYGSNSISENLNDELCPIRPIVKPAYNGSIQKILYDDDFKNGSIKKLSGAVQINTEGYDDTGNVGEDSRWDRFADFHKYLERTFSLVYKHLKVEKVNTYGLIFIWEGSDEALKPILLMAHQDTVPVDPKVYDKWEYPPFSGYYDGELIWGRGVSDCKNLLIGLLEAIEALVDHKFEPKRTIILSFGFDEESSGEHGAYLLGQFLLKKYGENSIFAIIDEGSGIEEVGGVILASPATAEKGHLNVIITLDIAGGHSSFPPDHTAIGVVSQLINVIESTPFEPRLTNINPTSSFLQCVAVHSTEISSELRSNILKAHLDRDANKAVVDFMDYNRNTRYLLKTSQAADIINGGVKSNALPESVTLLMNSRIAIESSVKATGDKYLDNVVEIAKKYEIGVIYNGEVIIKQDSIAKGVFNVTLNEPLEPAPITPASGKSWDLLAGTVRHLYENLAPSAFPAGKDQDGNIISKPLYMAPILMTGNTDTQRYWALTKNIYRFTPIKSRDDNIHKVDENLLVSSHLYTIAFFHEYILNADALEGN